jgi:endo-1,4-beta-xylanase
LAWANTTAENHSPNVTNALYSDSFPALSKGRRHWPSHSMTSRFRPFPTLVAILIGALGVPGPSTNLRQAADHAGMLIGTAVRPSQFSEAAYIATLAREYNMIEPEDAMKWWVLRREQDTFDFRQGDEVIRFAQAHAMKVRGHCLVWGRTNPDWLTQGRFTSAQLSQLLHQHIDQVMRHYAGQVFAWDVVNEALDENGRVRDSLWYNQPGIGFAGKEMAYIEQTFRWAREADPHALLFYNEAEGEGLGRKSNAIYAMVKDFRSRGVPIDGVGLQLHISQLNADIPGIAANIARLAALGLQVHTTELDVSLPVDAHGELVHKEDLQRQAEIYRGIVRACLQHPGCTAIQTWGFTDKYSWVGSSSHGTRGWALPFDRAYQPKLVYDTVLEELRAGIREGRSASH